MTTEEATIKLQAKVAEIQSESHSFVRDICKETNCSYQDAMNVYLFSRIAALELHIETLIQK